jgi:hypothetical protein
MVIFLMFARERPASYSFPTARHAAARLLNERICGVSECKAVQFPQQGRSMIEGSACADKKLFALHAGDPQPFKGCVCA